MAGNANFDTLAATTIKNYQRTLVDNIFYANPFFAYMMEKGSKRTESGGTSIVEPLMYGVNSTFDGLSSQYGVIDVTPQTGISAAEYQWALYGGSVVISGHEKRVNRSEQQIINLLQAKMDQLVSSAKRTLNTDLFSTSNDNGLTGPVSSVNGLQAFVAVSPTTGTVGGINRATDTWWRNNSTASVGSFAANGLDNMRTMYNSASQEGASMIDLIVTTQTVFESYEKTGQSIQRTQNTKMLDLGFQNFEYKGATMFYDADCPSGYMYFLNTKFLRVVEMEGANLTIGKMQEPIDQDASVAKLVWEGNLTMSNAAHQGVLSGITA